MGKPQTRGGAGPMANPRTELGHRGPVLSKNGPVPCCARSLPWSRQQRHGLSIHSVAEAESWGSGAVLPAVKSEQHTRSGHRWYTECGQNLIRGWQMTQVRGTLREGLKIGHWTVSLELPRFPNL